MAALGGDVAARRLRGAALECASDDECGPNEVCDGDGQCVAACNPWGMGSYGHCLDDYGGFDSVRHGSGTAGTRMCLPRARLCPILWRASRPWGFA